MTSSLQLEEIIAKLSPEELAAIKDSVDGNTITEAFILDDDGTILIPGEDGKIVPPPAKNSFLKDAQEKFDASRNLVSKSLESSNVGEEEIKCNDAYTLDSNNIVEPPYDPGILSSFLEIDETHFRACTAKATDAVGRSFYVEKTVGLNGDTPTDLDESDKQLLKDDIQEIENFLEEANEIFGFDGVLYKAAMDHESIGWAAIEVIRSVDFKIRHIQHAPANRMRVVKGWRGFVEERGGGKYMRFQQFGNKVLSTKRVDPITGKHLPYNPRLDGKLDSKNAKWNLIDKETGEPTNNFSKAANEIIWIPKYHPLSIYYGLTDVLPAAGSIFINAFIRDYQLQFFKNNTVPRYAIIIEGAKIAPDVLTLIQKYFTQDIRGNAHKTLVIPVPALGNEVRVKFEKLDADSKEGSFQETRKNNAQNIMTAHGLGPAILGVAEASNLGSGKGLSQAELYKDRIVQPSQIRWANVINRLFRLGLGILSIKIKFVPLDIRDMKAESETLLGYLERGCLTINEVRQKANLGGAIEDGNTPFIISSQGTIKIEELMNNSQVYNQQNLQNKDSKTGEVIQYNTLDGNE